MDRQLIALADARHVKGRAECGGGLAGAGKGSVEILVAVSGLIEREVDPIFMLDHAGRMV